MGITARQLARFAGLWLVVTILLAVAETAARMRDRRMTWTLPVYLVDGKYRAVTESQQGLPPYTASGGYGLAGQAFFGDLLPHRHIALSTSLTVVYLATHPVAEFRTAGMHPPLPADEMEKWSTIAKSQDAVFARPPPWYQVMIFNRAGAEMRRATTGSATTALILTRQLCLGLAGSLAATLGLVAAGHGVRFLIRARGRRRLARGLCPHCTYNLRTAGSSDPSTPVSASRLSRCPECGVETLRTT